jgi:hypothetical protein
MDKNEKITAQNVGVWLSAHKPTRLGDQVIVEGDSTHPHTWMHKDFLSPIDFDEAAGMATFRNLYRCDCGREVIVKTRALY